MHPWEARRGSNASSWHKLGVVCTGITGAEPSPAVCSGCSIALQGECPDVGVMLEFLLGEVQPEHHTQPGWPVASSLPATSTCHPEGFKSSRGRGCGAGEAVFPLLCIASRALPRRCLPAFARLPVPASYPAQASPHCRQPAVRAPLPGPAPAAPAFTNIIHIFYYFLVRS